MFSCCSRCQTLLRIVYVSMVQRNNNFLFPTQKKKKKSISMTQTMMCYPLWLQLIYRMAVDVKRVCTYIYFWQLVAVIRAETKER